jgi:transposase
MSVNTEIALEQVAVENLSEVGAVVGRKALVYTEVKRLHKGEGWSQRAIARHLQISRRTVSKYLQAEQVPRYTLRAVRPSKLDLYKPYLEQRWQEGVCKSHRLYAEIKKRGYRGSWSLLAQYLAKYGLEHPRLDGRKTRHDRKPKVVKVKRAKRPQPIMSAREASLLMTWKAGELSAEQHVKLKHLLKFDEEIAAAYELSQEFAIMLRERKGVNLESWLERVEQKVAEQQLREIGSFARGIRLDQAAVKAGLTMEISQGQVEGQVNRLKTLKRAMFGRASFETLKARVLHRN